MPAARSRTENWRRSLDQICERNGALEITLPRYFAGGNPSGGGSDSEKAMGQNLIWRVRVLSVTDDEIIVEQPSTMGQTIRLETGVDLVGVIIVGQNRWMFHTRNLGHRDVHTGGARGIIGLRLAMPTTVERCQRRCFYRISTVGLVLPDVSCWPVLDHSSLAAAELANEARIQFLEEEIIAGPAPNSPGGPAAPESPSTQGLLMPEVGPVFPTKLVNVGGGGVGLLIEPQNASGVERCRLFWLAIDLQPHIPAPVGVAAKLAHTHIDSEQRVYAGMGFEFGASDQHKRFVVDRICKYVNLVQREQLQRRAEMERKGA